MPVIRTATGSTLNGYSTVGEILDTIRDFPADVAESYLNLTSIPLDEVWAACDDCGTLIFVDINWVINDVTLCRGGYCKETLWEEYAIAAEEEDEEQFQAEAWADFIYHTEAEECRFDNFDYGFRGRI